MSARAPPRRGGDRNPSNIAPTDVRTCSQRWSPRLPLRPCSRRERSLTRPHRDAAGERRGRPESPDEVVLEFNEAVDASLGSLRVFDGQGVQVDGGDVTQPVASEVAVGIDSELAPGTCTVAWRVVSADSDPISGAFVFTKERGVAANVSIDALTGTSQAVDVLFVIGRFVDFAFLSWRSVGRRCSSSPFHRHPGGSGGGCTGSCRRLPAGWPRSRW